VSKLSMWWEQLRFSPRTRGYSTRSARPDGPFCDTGVGDGLGGLVCSEYGTHVGV
jgi:hypothetical protein